MKSLLVSPILLLLLIPSFAYSATAWDFAEDFSTGSNTSGPWSYGYRTTADSSGFTLMPSNGTFDNMDFWYYTGPGAGGLPSIGKNNTAVTQSPALPLLAAGEAMLHPGNNTATEDFDAVVRWTAPTNGNYLVDALFTAIDPRGVDVSTLALLNGVLLFNDFVSGTGDNSHLQSLMSLSAGDNIDFVVANRFPRASLHQRFNPGLHIPGRNKDQGLFTSPGSLQQPHFIQLQ